jgi:hypothetical protein
LDNSSEFDKVLMPLPTTFAGVSARGEGLFALNTVAAVTGSHIYYSTAALSGTTYTWTCPTGVTSVSVVAVGAGGWGNSTGSYTGSYFSSTSVCYATSGTSAVAGTAVAGTGFSGGAGKATSYSSGGGGAAGYTSNGGAGGANNSNASGTAGSSSTDGGGGGGGSYVTTGKLYAVGGGGGGGGGVGLYGSNVGYSSTGGAGGTTSGSSSSSPGSGGGSGSSSGGTGGQYNTNNAVSGSSDQYGYGVGGLRGVNSATTPGTFIDGGGGGGGAFGGGGGGSPLNTIQSGDGSGYGGGLAYINNYSVTPGNTYTVYVAGPKTNGNASSGGGGSGGVRIVWPGATRQFPSTSVSTTTNEIVN